jgi:hypothetical protein
MSRSSNKAAPPVPQAIITTAATEPLPPRVGVRSSKIQARHLERLAIV